MTDSKLRELEHRWKETQSVEDEAAYLRERVRVGDLEKKKLELAAYCGHEAARVALGERAPTIPEEFGEWVTVLDDWGLESAVRASLALEPLVLEVLHGKTLTVRTPHQLPTQAREWVGDPTLMAHQFYSLVKAWLDPSRRGETQMTADRLEEESTQLHEVLEIIAHDNETDPTLNALALPDWTTFSLYQEGGTSTIVWNIGLFARATSAEKVSAAIRATLISWTLGYSDPVQDQEEARNKAAE